MIRSTIFAVSGALLLAGCGHGGRVHEVKPYKIRVPCSIGNVRIELLTPKEVNAKCSAGTMLGFTTDDSGRIMREGDEFLGCFRPVITFGDNGPQIGGNIYAPAPEPARWWNPRSRPILWDEIEHLLLNACQEVAPE